VTRVTLRCGPGRFRYSADVSSPRVSILLPVFNGARFLRDCLRSIERQTIEEYELVVVDDGSTDGTAEILEAWGKGDDRLRVLSRPHRGLVAALNEGLEHCRAPLIARMDADDIAHPRRLELQLDLFEERPDLDVVSCRVRHFPARRVAEGFRLYDRWLNSLLDHEAMARERFVESPVAHPSVVFRRSVIERAGGYRDRGWPEDYDLWLRLFKAGARFAKVERELLFWRERPDRLSRTDGRYASSAFLACTAHHFARGPARGRAVVLWGAGPNGRKLYRLLRAEDVDIPAVIDIDPRKIGRRIGEAPILPPDQLTAVLGPDVLVAAAVASRGARALIRERLEASGLTEGRDFWCLL